MADPYYADFGDGLACRFSTSEGWVLHDDWVQLNSASVNNAARILTKEQFDQRFPSAPPLPAKAFTA